jgi:hypothetical protein
LVRFGSKGALLERLNPLLCFDQTFTIDTSTRRNAVASAKGDGIVAFAT